MGKFIVLLTQKAKDDLAKHKKSGNKASEKKLKRIHPVFSFQTKSNISQKTVTLILLKTEL